MSATLARDSTSVIVLLFFFPKPMTTLSDDTLDLCLRPAGLKRAVPPLADPTLKCDAAL